jgi:MFS family permease
VAAKTFENDTPDELEFSAYICQHRRVGLGRAFWRFGASAGLSNVADGIFLVCLPLLALRVTRSPLLISGVEFAVGLPWLLFALIAGAIADRADRRRLMIGVNLSRVGVLAVLALLVASGDVQLWVLYLVALAMGIAETLYDTSEMTVLPTVVPEPLLEKANSRLSGIEVIGAWFVGPPLGGLILAVSATLAVATGSLAYVVATLAVIGIPGRFRADRTGPRTSIRTDVANGLRFLLGQRLLLRFALVGGGMMVLFSAVNAILPVYAVAPGPMGLSATGYGLFMGSTAIGAVIASVTAERVIASLGPGLSLKVAVVAMAATLASPLAVNPFAVAALWVFEPYFVTVWSVVTVSIRQRMVPAELLGRVNSAYRLVTWGAMPAGALLGGLVAERLGPRVTFVGCALLSLLLLLGTRPFTDRALSAAVAAAVAEPAQAGPEPAR